jgi:hypothetical protein
MAVSTLLKRGLQMLAVSAPRCSERDNCIMIFVLQGSKSGTGQMKGRQATYEDDVVECVSIEDDRRRRGRRFDVRLDT